jgi:hypothetical protein
MMYIFGGVDTSQQRFNDLYSFDLEKRVWNLVETKGKLPQARTFHRAVTYGNIMYILGGFDGSRLNDMHHIALPLYLRDEEGDSIRLGSRPPSSSLMRTVPSDLVTSFNNHQPVYEEEKTLDSQLLIKKVILLKKQVDELSKRLKIEEDRMDNCKVCYSREIDTVFLECAHRTSCFKCSKNLKMVKYFTDFSVSNL